MCECEDFCGVVGVVVVVVVVGVVLLSLLMPRLLTHFKTKLPGIGVSIRLRSKKWHYCYH